MYNNRCTTLTHTRTDGRIEIRIIHTAKRRNLHQQAHPQNNTCVRGKVCADQQTQCSVTFNHQLLNTVADSAVFGKFNIKTP